MNRVLGIEIKFKPIVGNMDHIKIMHNLSEIFKLRTRYEKAVEASSTANKIYNDIHDLELTTRNMIKTANEN